MNEIGIDIENVTVAYHGKVALHSASLQLQPGTICGLVGMNGAGKSTLFKAIMGFVRPNTGRVLINGLPIRKVQKKKSGSLCASVGRGRLEFSGERL